MSEQWIVIPNWDKFQHYGDREPTWIKVYTELSHRDDWRRLTHAERGLLLGIWIEYACGKGQLRTSDVPPRSLRRPLDVPSIRYRQRDSSNFLLANR